MALIDSITNAVNKFIPQKKDGYPKPLSTASGGIGHGMQFDDEMPLSKPAIVYYACQLFFTFVAMCCFASVASFQAKWKIGPSGLSGFAIFVAVTSMLLSAFLLMVPVIYDKYDRLVRLARTLQEVRVAFILATTGLLWSLLISFVTTISAFTQAGCKNPDNDPHASLGDTYKTQLKGWCTTKKAGAVFFWFAFASWVATFVVAVLEWRSGNMRGSRRNNGREESFVPPAHDDAESVFTRDQYDRHPNDDDDDEEEEEHKQHRSPFADQAPQLPPPSFALDPQPRVSMDAYGAFNDPVPSGYGGSDPTSPSRPVSHVSPLATTPDPYAQIRANIGAATPPTFNPPPAPVPAPVPPASYPSAPPNYVPNPPTFAEPGYTGAGAPSYGQAGGFVAPSQPPAQQSQYQYPTYQ
ncbi:Membrane-associating domain containing protein [Ceratobasidium theobromae]|uniref:Membrane-associating domain containing protein n=1 Tax=Ceratobasidium theobromae TaxID=1582974 RepID=A0A5N5QWZ3_9AGAM|nr:Membrane-associating domain containing protein [Ceratobasidium theobromae]